jgi:hypothetical protein
MNNIKDLDEIVEIMISKQLTPVSQQLDLVAISNKLKEIETQLNKNFNEIMKNVQHVKYLLQENKNAK